MVYFIVGILVFLINIFEDVWLIGEINNILFDFKLNLLYLYICV